MEKATDTAATARKHLVERRSALIRSLGCAQEDEQLEAHMDLIVRIRGVIDLIGRIAREKRAVP